MPSGPNNIGTHAGRPSTLWLAWLCAAIVSMCAPRQPGWAQPPASEPSDAAAAGGDEQPAANESVEVPLRLLDRDPFDRITLDAANGSAVIDTVLLDLPERRVPDPLPESGMLSLRRLSEPSIPYEVQWSAIEKVELYEYMLLAEAERLTAAGEYREAFEYFAFLSANYPQLPGLEAALQSHLWREASATYAAGNRDEAWPVLRALYLRNPQYPRLVNAVQAVSDDMISARLKDGDYAGARAVLSVLEEGFGDPPLQNVARWTQQFESDAREQMEIARTAFAEKQYIQARAALNHARLILPDIEGGEQLWKQIEQTAPEIRVGVMQPAASAPLSRLPTWPEARGVDLTDPRLVDMIDFGAEGGVYASQWAEITTSNDGLETTLRLSPAAISRGLAPAALALQLTEMGASGSPREHEDFALAVSNVRIANGQDVIVRWRHPHVRPEALLQVPLRWVASDEPAAGLWFDRVQEEATPTQQRYQRVGPPASATGAPHFILEQIFENDDAALEALVSGKVDVLDRVPPWQLQRMEQSDGIAVAPYRLPTIHVLIPNLDSPLMETREFRRAICYGINAESILHDILLAGESRPGFRTLSGPFLAGASLSDPLGYAYDANIPPRPYEPRLAALLSGVARATLAKRDAQAKKEPQSEGSAVEGENAEPASTEADDSASSNPDEGDKIAPPPASPIVLAHPANPIARLACQTIKIQLDSVGIPITLAEFAGAAPPVEMKYDLRYAEIAMWEPIVDARRLLGRNGLAGRTSPLAALALDQLAASENWNQARAHLNEIHRIAHYDLPVLPLWQTVNHFAYRTSIAGVGSNPVALYQNLSAWRKSFE